MKEPYASDAFEGPGYVGQRAGIYKKWREIAISLPKFGSGSHDVDKYGHWVVDQIFAAQEWVLNNPIVKSMFESIDQKYAI